MRRFASITDLRITAEDVRAIDDALPPYPAAEIEQLFKSGNLKCVEDIPSSFSKYLAVISGLAGGYLEGIRLLDVGTGLGVFVAQAKSLGIHAQGSDSFGEYGDIGRHGALAVFRAYGYSEDEANRAFIQNDITKNPAAEERFDFVTSFGMHEHIFGEEARRSAVRNMMESLVPGGTLILVCAPNQYFPVDLFHYGPKFLFYHCLPLSWRYVYLRTFANPARHNLDARWLTGMKVSEIRRHLLDAEPESITVQAFPVWVSLATSRFLRLRPVRWLAIAAAKLLSATNTEPVIILLTRKPARAPDQQGRD